MTAPTADLMHEHQAIRRMLSVMDRIGNRLESGEDVDPDDLDRIIEFIRVFADSCHHGKEEGLLFVEMEKAGVPREGGPIEVMNREHEMGRSYVAGLAEAAERYKADPQDRGAAQAVAENARGYIGLLSSHIDKEDNVLYPMANRQLSDEQQEELVKGFERIEEEKIGPGKHEEFHRLIEELEEKYPG